jgi:hypothetical protein
MYNAFALRKADGNDNLQIGANIRKQDIFNIGTQTFCNDERPFNIRLRR